MARIHVMSRRAFTLLEVLIVIALVAVIGALVVVDFIGASERYAKSNDIESLMESVAHARATAFSVHKRVRITFDFEDHALVARCGDDVRRFPLKGTVKFVLPSDETHISVRDISAVEFAPEGDATPVIFVLQGERTHRFRLEPFSQSLSEEAR